MKVPSTTNPLSAISVGELTTDQIISHALAEDLHDGDHTSLATVAAGAIGTARLIIKDQGILCGMMIVERIYTLTDPDLKMRVYLHDGDAVKKGDIAFEISGRERTILSTERLVLNFMQRLSGIATATNHLVSLIKDLPTKIIDTRKTTPNLRGLEKYAVRTGGGENHRMGLYDMIMIKDNHVDYAGGIVPAIEAVHEYFRRTGKDLKIEIEVRNSEELDQVIRHGRVHRIMLDNFTPENLKKAVSLIGNRYETEASGGINEKNVRSYAETGVNFISIGALTHHIKSLDMSLKAVTNDE
jgi:nicotinate-nucleotide pyrophosphorylase (carboxylating)